MADQIIQMLNNLGRHYVVKRWAKGGRIATIAYLECNKLEHCQVVRWWYFDEFGKVEDTNYHIALDAEIDLLAVYADELDTYGTDSWYQIEWH